MHIFEQKKPRKSTLARERARRDSNPRSFESESNTLSTELRAHVQANSTIILAFGRNIKGYFADRCKFHEFSEEGVFCEVFGLAVEVLTGVLL